MQAPDSTALAAALAHVRTVIPEGRIQISPDTLPPAPALQLEAAAQQAELSYGSDDEAVRCHDPGPCRAVGRFRGLVHVFDYRQVDPDSVVVRLRILRFDPSGSSLYEQVDDVHVARHGPTSAWRIEKVVVVSVS